MYLFQQIDLLRIGDQAVAAAQLLQGIPDEDEVVCLGVFLDCFDDGHHLVVGCRFLEMHQVGEQFIPTDDLHGHSDHEFVQLELLLRFLWQMHRHDPRLCSYQTLSSLSSVVLNHFNNSLVLSFPTNQNRNMIY